MVWLFRCQTWLFSVGAVVILLSLNALVFTANTRTLVEQHRQVSRSQNILSTLYRLRSSLADAETGQRGYILTGQPSYLHPYTTARREIEPELARLVTLTTHDPLQRQLPSLRSLIAAKLNELQATIDLRRTAGAAQAMGVVLSGVGARTMDNIRSQLDTMQQVESARLDNHVAQAQDAANSTTITLIAATAIDAFLLAGLVVLLQRNATHAALIAADRARLLTHAQSARAEAEAERQTARAERDRLQQVLDGLPEGVLVADLTPRYILGNQAAVDILGVDLAGTPVPVHADASFARTGPRRIDGSPYEPATTPIYRSLLYGEIVRGEQMLLRTIGSDADVPVLANSTPIRNTDGERIGAMIVFQDITAIKDLERQKDEFFATVSHDLKNPLTGVIGMAQVLLRRASQIEGPEGSRMVDGITTLNRAADTMAQQIATLLDGRRLQMGRALNLNLASTDLVPLVEQTEQVYQQMSADHTLHFETELPSLICVCDAARLQRVLGNLITNAIKYSPSGGPITISLVREIRDNTPWAAISVRDQGIGIPDEDLPHVFERYYRAGNVGQISGTGIGLAGVRQIMEQLGGSVMIASAQGRGTTATIRLPLQVGGDGHTTVEPFAG